MLITYASIVLMTQVGFLSANTSYLAYLYVIYQIVKNKKQILCLKLSKKKFKNRSNFPDKCLILHCLFKIKVKNLV